MTVQYTGLGFLTLGGYIFLDNMSILNEVQLPSYWINFKDGNLRPHSLGSSGGHWVGSWWAFCLFKLYQVTTYTSNGVYDV